MKLTSLETINDEELTFINGGNNIDYNHTRGNDTLRNDSLKQDGLGSDDGLIKP